MKIEDVYNRIHFTNELVTIDLSLYTFVFKLKIMTEPRKSKS